MEGGCFFVVQEVSMFQNKSIGINGECCSQVGSFVLYLGYNGFVVDGWFCIVIGKYDDIWFGVVIN